MSCTRKPFLKFTKDNPIDHLGENERHLLGTDRDLVLTYKWFVRSFVMLFLALYLLF